jgi:hypothetical protein
MRFHLYGFVHFVCFILITIYPLVWAKSKYDYVFLYFSILLFLSWMFLNGECFVSYFEKIARDPQYYAGKDPTNNEDMYFIDNSRDWMDRILHLFFVVWIMSLFLALTRQSFPIWLAIWICSIPYFYMYLLGVYTDYAYNEGFQYWQNICKWALLGALVVFYTYPKLG